MNYLQHADHVTNEISANQKPNEQFHRITNMNLITILLDTDQIGNKTGMLITQDSSRTSFCAIYIRNLEEKNSTRQSYCENQYKVH